MDKTGKLRIIFLIGSLRSGGKERRLIELLAYLKSTEKYELMVVLNHKEFFYNYFIDLNITFKILKKRQNYKDPSLFIKYYKVITKYNPNIIHTWGSMQTFYSLPASLLTNTPIVNSQITSAPPKIKKLSFSNIVNKINFKFSGVVLSNSKAGLDAYSVKGEKFNVIYNGINLTRFTKLTSTNEVKLKYDIKTPFAVIMISHISKKKDFEKYIKSAKNVLEKRKDITFLVVGKSESIHYMNKLESIASNEPNIKFTGRVSKIEELVNICDIGMLLSNKALHGEGIPNVVMEYMALKKPVIANDAGGTKEIVQNGINGYLVRDESHEDIGKMIVELIDNPEKRKEMGRAGRKLIEEHFTIDKMGITFEKIYMNVINKR